MCTHLYKPTWHCVSLTLGTNTKQLAIERIWFHVVNEVRILLGKPTLYWRQHLI